MHLSQLFLHMLSHVSPDVTECNQLLWYWPECFYEPVSLIHTQYTSVPQSAQQC